MTDAEFLIWFFVVVSIHKSRELWRHKKRYVKLWDWLAYEADQKEEEEKSPLS